MTLVSKVTSSWTQAVRQAVAGLRMWSVRQLLAAAAATIVFGLVLGIATVLIPNSLFSREIPPVWWNYPVWVATSLFSGMLLATYVGGTNAAAAESDAARARAERRTGRFGVAGAMAAWFAVGCPVCNKLALLALGYSGAITWFAPIQPFLAVGALALTGIALVWRLRGQVACPVKLPMAELAR